MAAVQLGTKAIGAEVKIKISGVAKNFIVVHHGNPGASLYDSSFNNGTWLLMKDVYTRMFYKGSPSTIQSHYGTSEVRQYLENDFYNLLEENIKQKLVKVNLPVVHGTTIYEGFGFEGPASSTTSSLKLSSKVFLLGAREVGSGIYDDHDSVYDDVMDDATNAKQQYIADDGSTLSYFSGIEDDGARSPKRIAYYGSQPIMWFLRTPSTWYLSGHSLMKVSRVGHVGLYRMNDFESKMDYKILNNGVRPAFILPGTMMVDDGGNVTTNTAPTVPPSITIPGTINGGVAHAVSWAASSDAQNNLSGYKLERSLSGGTWTQIFQANARSVNDTVPFGTNTVAYRVKAYDTSGLESTYQTSPTRTVINNTAPSAPGSITVPASVIGGASIVVTWAASSDAQNNLSGYILEFTNNGGGTWTQIYKGTALSCTHAVAKGWVTVQYRVRSYDSYNLMSGNTTSPARTVDNSVAPTITSAASGNIGLKNADFAWQYTVKQADNEKTTVVEKIDGVQLRSYTATLGQANTFSVTGQTFMALLNGARTMTVTATSAKGKSASYTVTFTKGVYSVSITLETPLPADADITKMVMGLNQSIPFDADYKIMATNNANDDSPAWEDITLFIKNGRNHVFTNTVFQNPSALNFIITASRGPSNTGGYITTIGGAYE